MTKTPLVAALAVLSVAATPTVALASKGDGARPSQIEAHRTIRECSLVANKARPSEAKRPFRCWEVKNCATDDVAFIQARFKNGWRVRTWLKRHEGWAVGDCTTGATERTAQARGRVKRQDGERSDHSRQPEVARPGAKEHPNRGKEQDRSDRRAHKRTGRREEGRSVRPKNGRVHRSKRGSGPATTRPTRP